MVMQLGEVNRIGENDYVKSFSRTGRGPCRDRLSALILVWCFLFISGRSFHAEDFTLSCISFAPSLPE